MTSVQANEKEREADSGRIKDAVKPLLGFQPEAGGSTVQDAKGDGIRYRKARFENAPKGNRKNVETESPGDVRQDQNDDYFTKNK